MAPKVLRCAVYTRKSTEHGLELEFNSLDAQREACESFIKSQVAEGWRLVPTPYDDGAYSGGDMDRPALQQLLRDIDGGLIDVIVVYKIDRLTRSLADFAKLVEIFDAKAISFVAVTQQFNTTTSMGRLTLNILLSFAQFERELSSERVRDKIAASRKKGKWTGGSVPLGYDTLNKKLVINKSEAKTVRMIFDRYLALKSFQKVIDELNAQGIVSKTRHAKKGKLGGVSFTYGPLAYLLRNRTYLGEMGYKGKWFSGEHKSILDAPTFAKVQDLLKENSEGRTGRRINNGALLTGLLFDDKDNRMSPSFAVKKGVRYRFYVSSAVIRGRKSKSGSVARISADWIETSVLRLAKERFPEIANDHPEFMQPAVRQQVNKIVVGETEVRISFKSNEDDSKDTIFLALPQKSEPKAEHFDPSNGRRRSDQKLLQAVVRAHSWIRLLAKGDFESVESLATSVNLNPKVIRNGIRLAFLSPSLTKALLENDYPPTLSLNKFNGFIPMPWKKQDEWIHAPLTE